MGGTETLLYALDKAGSEGERVDSISSTLLKRYTHMREFSLPCPNYMDVLDE